MVPSLWIFFCSCHKNLPSNSNFIINAEISGINGGRAELAKIDLHNNEKIVVGLTEIVDGKFRFNGSLHSPYLHSIIINDSISDIHIFLESGNFKLTGNINNLENLTFSGSREDSLFRSFQIDSIFNREVGMEIMMKYPSYTFASFVAYYQFQLYNIPIDSMEIILESFDESVQKSVYFKHLVRLYEKLTQVSISMKAPGFNMVDNNGNSVGLSDFIGQYVLIDFWASWCAPCRESHPKMVQLYNLFKDKNFTIIGISVDKNRNQWLKAIDQDGLEWVNLSNLNGWDEISNSYGVKAIPQNFLIDSNGVIIDKNIEVELIEERLNKILINKGNK